MKIKLIDQDLKAQGKRLFDDPNANSHNAQAGGKSEKVLMDQFSALMDKIAGKISDQRFDAGLRQEFLNELDLSVPIVERRKELKIPVFSTGCRAREEDICKEEREEPKDTEGTSNDGEETAVLKPVASDGEPVEVEVEVEGEVEGEEIPKAIICYAEDPDKETKEYVALEEQVEKVVEEQIAEEAILPEVPIYKVAEGTEPVDPQAVAQTKAAEVVAEETAAPELFEDLSGQEAKVTQSTEAGAQQKKDKDSETVKLEENVEVDVELADPELQERIQDAVARDHKGPRHEKKGEGREKAADAIEEVLREMLEEQTNAQSKKASSSGKENIVAPLVLRHVMESHLGGSSPATGSVSGIISGQGAEHASQQKDGKLENAPTQKAKALPKMMQQRTLDRVKEVLKEAAKSRDGKTLSLRLDPPSLGSVKVDVTFKDGTLHARIVAESPQVNQMLREKSAELQNILRRIGIQADSVTVSVRSDDHGGAEFGGFARDGESSGNTQQGSSDNGSHGEHVNKDGSKLNQIKSALIDHWVA